MDNPKISIITVSYNAANTIEQTILSVIGQNYQNIEYIIIDGGSTDGTIDIIKKYDKEISYWKSEPDNGIYDAMNKGIIHAQGDFIQIIGSDDCLVSNESIEKIVTYLDDSTEILSAKIYRISEKYKLQCLDKREITPSQIIQGEMIQHQGAFVKSEIMKENLFDINYFIAADYDFMLRCVLKDVKITYSPEVVTFFSTGGISSLKYMDTAQEYFNILKQYPESQPYAKNVYEKHIAPLESMGCFGKYRKRISKKIRTFLLLEKRSMLRRGWVKHRCKNQGCRWCDIK